MGKFSTLSLLGTASVASAIDYHVNYQPIPKDLSTPSQQRLAFKGPNAFSVGWSTFKKLDQSCVQYGLSEDDLCWEACSTNSETYDTSRTWFNEVTLNNLKPATTYYYKIGSTNSSIEHFFSGRTAGDETPFNIDVVIDLGVYGADGFTTKKRDDVPHIQPELNHSTIAQLANTIGDYEFVIHPGDLGYADDWQEKDHNLHDGVDAYQAILENFYDQLAPIAGRKAYMTSPGNHEADCTIVKHASGLCPYGQRNFTDFMVRFGKNMPDAYPSSSKHEEAKAKAAKAKALANPPFWYSFEYGMAHIVFIDTETDFPHAPGGLQGVDGLDAGPFGKQKQQREFLENDLASVDRSVTPWLIVTGHRPWYARGPAEPICEPCQEAFEEILYKYGTDIYVCGHVHNSQRFDPLYKNQTDPAGLHDPKAPMYIIAGGPGNIEGTVPIGESMFPGNKFAYDAEFSYAGLKLHNKTHLEVDFYNSQDGRLLDQSVLYKPHNEAFVRQG